MPAKIDEVHSSKETALFTDEETAQRRDEIVRLMANAPPQTRTAKLPSNPRRKAAPIASGRRALASDAKA